MVLVEAVNRRVALMSLLAGGRAPATMMIMDGQKTGPAEWIHYKTGDLNQDQLQSGSLVMFDESVA